jgi:outer membrane lipoprotein carrier protein
MWSGMIALLLAAAMSMPAAAQASRDGREPGAGRHLAQGEARGMKFEVYIRLKQGMSEAELLQRAGPPDYESTEGTGADGPPDRRCGTAEKRGAQRAHRSREELVLPANCGRSVHHAGHADRRTYRQHREDEGILMNIRRTIAAVSFTLAAASARAGPIEQLDAFVKGTREARADFSQTVFDGDGKKIQESKGIVEFSRPGRFRWHYRAPFEQLVVGDGERLWIYDKDLNQVTTRKLDGALGSSPAALLAGSDDIDKYFSLNAVGKQGRYEWLEVKPYDKDSMFERVRMGFSRNTLQVMELFDHFSQKTVIRFSGFKRNPGFAANAFSFSPPVGADVVTE